MNIHTIEEDETKIVFKVAKNGHAVNPKSAINHLKKKYPDVKEWTTKTAPSHHSLIVTGIK